ncbi:MAG: glycosyltransferase family 2 protein [Coriobacteriia bacterium]
MTLGSAEQTTARPLVSILTPSFNQAAWLADNLASVSCQTHRDIEHVVMDGGSTDGSVDILRAAGDSIIWRSEPDGGQANAVNKAFAASHGEIIGWLNSDDAYFDTRAVEDVVAFFDKHPDVDVVYGHAARIDTDGKVFRILHVPRFNLRHLLWECFLVQPAVFIRRRAIEDAFVNEDFHFAMDWELWLRLSQTRKFARLDRVLAVDRVQADRKMLTWLDVLEADMNELEKMYGVWRPKSRRWQHRYYFVTGRLAGASHILFPVAPLAFPGGQDTRWALLKKQVASRSSNWPEGYV